MKATFFRVFLVSLWMGVLVSLPNVQPVNATATIYIHADGTVSPSEVSISSVDCVTYTLIGTIYDSIVIERSNIIVDGAGCTVQGFGIGEGLRLYGVNNVTIRNVNIKDFTYSIYLDLANDSVISGNNMTANNFGGIELHDSSNNTISGNDIKANEWYGIGLYYSSNNLIEKNNITDNYSGIRFYHSSNNVICQNHLAHNFYGIGISNSSNNSIFHNNFINNTNNVHCGSSIDVWDDGYPSGGNYWSDYNGTDLYRGSFQNETGGDGVGDTPQVLCENNQDDYPLMKPYVFLLGDVNHDRSVNILDLSMVGQAFGSQLGSERWNQLADLDRNEVINVIDLTLVAMNYGKTV